VTPGLKSKYAMATPFLERFTQTRPKPPATAGRAWRAALGDARFRQRGHGIALILVSVVGLGTGLLVPGLWFATLVAAGMGVYGFHLWRR